MAGQRSPTQGRINRGDFAWKEGRWTRRGEARRGEDVGGFVVERTEA